MKIACLLFTLLLTSAVSLAQTAFTKATLERILNDYHKNPHDFFKNYCSSDMRYIAPDGSFGDLSQLLEASVNDKVETSQILDQKIIQSGDVAVVSGIHVQERKATDGTKMTRRVACTYTFQRQNGKGTAPRWMFVASQQSNITQHLPDQINANEVAVRQTVETETAAFIDADYKTYLSQWARVPYASFAYGAGLFIGDGLWTKLDEVWATRKPEKRTVTRSNWNLRINGTSAYVSYNQGQDLGDGKPHDTLESRYLEKTSGGWKIVGSNVLLLSN